MLFGLKRKTSIQEKVDQYIRQGSIREINTQDMNFYTKPGVYGWNKIDQGSKILIENISNDLSGVGADFGCGYGYISTKILNGNNQIKKLYAIDADANAIKCCQKNFTKV